MAVGTGDVVKLVGVQVYGDCSDGVFHGVYLPNYATFIAQNIA